jgi:hypothetical protein
MSGMCLSDGAGMAPPLRGGRVDFTGGAMFRAASLLGAEFPPPLRGGEGESRGVSRVSSLHGLRDAQSSIAAPDGDEDLLPLTRKHSWRE